jgi:hypothetical protein
MNRALGHAAVASLGAAMMVVAASAAVRCTSTWSAPDAASVSFKGQKVAALVISDDMSLRMSAEEALAKELSAHGMQGVAAYRLIPAEELRDPDRAKAWFARESIAGVATLRPVSHTKEQRPPVEMWTSPAYSTFWGYYPYSYSAVYVIGGNRTDSVVVVESLIFNVATGKLLWGGMSEAVNPKTLQTLVADIVKEAANKIEKRFR